jgi:hypothetical protein
MYMLAATRSVQQSREEETNSLMFDTPGVKVLRPRLAN